MERNRQYGGPQVDLSEFLPKAVIYWVLGRVFGLKGNASTACAVLGPIGGLVRGLFIVALMTQFMLVPIRYLAIKSFGALYKLPNNIIMPTILVFCIVGSYALRFSMFDVGIMLVFGLLGCFMKRNEIPLVPLILAIILGMLIERQLWTGLMKTGGSVLPFFTRPISSGVITAIILFFWTKVETLISRIRGEG